MPRSAGQATRFMAVSGPGAHGVHVAERVGRGELPEPVGRVDDGREEVDRLHQAEVVGDARDGGVVVRLEQPRELRGAARQSVEHGLQVARTQLRRSAALGCELCEADLVGHGASLPHGCTGRTGGRPSTAGDAGVSVAAVLWASSLAPADATGSISRLETLEEEVPSWPTHNAAPTRYGRARWPRGRGAVTLASSGAAGPLPVTWASRTERSERQDQPRGARRRRARELLLHGALGHPRRRGARRPTSSR